MSPALLTTCLVYQLAGDWATLVIGLLATTLLGETIYCARYFHGGARGAERSLLFSNALPASEIESAPDGVLAVETQPPRASFNRKFAEMWNLSSATARLKDPEAILEAVLSQVKNAESYR